MTTIESSRPSELGARRRSRTRSSWSCARTPGAQSPGDPGRSPASRSPSPCATHRTREPGPAARPLGHEADPDRPAARTARVQPGVTPDELVEAAAHWGLAPLDRSARLRAGEPARRARRHSGRRARRGGRGAARELRTGRATASSSTRPTGCTSPQSCTGSHRGPGGRRGGASPFAAATSCATLRAAMLPSRSWPPSVGMKPTNQRPGRTGSPSVFAGRPRGAEHAEVADERVEAGAEAGRGDHRVGRDARAVREQRRRRRRSARPPRRPRRGRAARRRRCRRRGSASCRSR